MRLALVSALFNYPSRGGGIADTVGVGRALERAGIEIVHVYARQPRWPTGEVLDPPFAGTAVDISGRSDLGSRMRESVAALAPDAVMVFLRLHAYELICPATNLRALPWGAPGSDCPNTSLLDPERCRRCVRDSLAGAGRPSLRAYEARAAGASGPALFRQIREALDLCRVVFVNNRLAQEWLGSYAAKAVVAGSGADLPDVSASERIERPGRPVIFMAGGVEDRIKGYAVLLDACRILWQEGETFELWATASEPRLIAGGKIRLTGWLGRDALAAHYAAADIAVVPSVCHESFGIVAVEAMAAGVPVVASRVGGLQEIVVHGRTGLLFERGNAADLAAALRVLLRDPALRKKLGQAGRRRFRERYTWDEVARRHYLPALAKISK